MNATNKQRNVSKPNLKAQTPVESWGFHPLEILARRRWQLFACLMVVGTVAFASMFLSNPKYEAVAQVQVKGDTPGAGGLAGLMGGVPTSGGGNYFKTQCKLIQSQHVLAQAAEKLGMAHGDRSNSGRVVEEMRECVKIKPVAGSQLIEVIGVAESSEKAAAIANQVTTTFIEISTLNRQKNNARVAKGIKEQIGVFDREIQLNEELLDSFRQEHRITGTGQAVAASRSRVTVLEQELNQVQMQRLVLEPEIERLKAMLTDGHKWSGAEEQLPQINSDKTINRLQQDIQELRHEHVLLVQAYLPGHTKLRDARLRIADMEVRLNERKERLLRALYENSVKQRSVLSEREGFLAKNLEQRKADTLLLSGHYQKAKTMLAELEMVHRFRKDCVTQLRQFSLEQSMLGSPVVMVDEAREPNKQSGLKATQRAGSILLIGLLFSLTFVLAVERLSAPPEPYPNQAMQFATPFGNMQNWNQPIMYWPGQTGMPGQTYSPAEAEEKPVSTGAAAMTGATPAGAIRTEASPVLGQIGSIDLGGSSRDDAAFAGRCRIVHSDQSSRGAQMFRQISTGLLSRFGDSQQSIVVTSRKRMAGKTTCACNLALTLAQAGRKVVLVDINPGATALGRVFTADQDKADIGDVLANPGVLDEALQETSVSNLKILHNNDTSESQVDRQGWLHQTNTNSLSELNRKLAQRFDWVIYDSGTIQARLTSNLLHAVGKGLLVCCGDEVDQQDNIVEQVEHCGALSIGCVENLPNAVFKQPVGAM